MIKTSHQELINLRKKEILSQTTPALPNIVGFKNGFMSILENFFQPFIATLKLLLGFVVLLIAGFAIYKTLNLWPTFGTASNIGATTIPGSISQAHQHYVDFATQLSYFIGAISGCRAIMKLRNVIACDDDISGLAATTIFSIFCLTLPLVLSALTTA